MQWSAGIFYDVSASQSCYSHSDDEIRVVCRSGQRRTASWLAIFRVARFRARWWRRDERRMVTKLSGTI